MNIVDAIKSGKPIRRKDPRFGPCFGKVITDFESVVFLYSGNVKIPIVVADIIADDWEIEPTDKENSPEIKKLKQENEKLKREIERLTREPNVQERNHAAWINAQRY